MFMAPNGNGVFVNTLTPANIFYYSFTDLLGFDFIQEIKEAKLNRERR